ncbi:MAG: Glu-tRNA(Gln) amidotransferase subunit GatE [archaeon]|nr:Glu-tRNA(Gln) amidotransferase subunit GatE [archaeon]MDA1167361.1 Glu-tRNA(Gln) amidotransferase subunit GatE [archaeon]
MAGALSEPSGDISSPEFLDCDELGFMCGLEIHQQLATGKLHSRQRGELFDVAADSVPAEWYRTHRRLRAPKGESGSVDVAAKFEQARKRSFEYVQSPNAGLIELDESPPLPLDEQALDISLTVSALLQAQPLPLLQTMRKTVVDGSNTSGFQRTTLVATNGILSTTQGDVGIDVICLEEDSARKLDSIKTDDGTIVLYNLDRLGIPLIEIATAPDVKSPEHAQETAIGLGKVLRQTRRVRRGLGSIRQDLNVSIGCGDRVEIKGCQDLQWIPQIIRLEMARQLHFYRLANTLRASIKAPMLPAHRNEDDEGIEQEVKDMVSALFSQPPRDVSVCFSSSTSDMVVKGLGQKNIMLGLKLPHLAGHLGTKTIDASGAQMPRLGRELAGAAKLAGVQGIFHSDELPAYGITQDEVDDVRKHLELSDGDGFALCLAPSWQAVLALESVKNRAQHAWHRIPKEVRNVVVKKGAPEDGTTTPMRPLPGSSRMYPETDVQTNRINVEHWNQIKSNLPPDEDERFARLQSSGISEDQARQLLSREEDDKFFEYLADLPPKFWAALMLDYEGQSSQLLQHIAQLHEKNICARDHIDNVVHHFSTDSNASFESIQAYCEQHGLAPASADDLATIIDNVLAERKDFILEKGLGAMGPLMGVVMLAAGGADGKQVSTLLRQAIQRMIE